MSKNKNLLTLALILIIFSSLISIFIIFNVNLDIILKSIAMAILLTFIFFNINNKIIFNPKMFMIVFLECAIFSTFGLSTQIDKWSYLMYLIVIVAAVSYLLPCIILSKDKGISVLEKKHLIKSKVVKVSSFLILISFLASSYEFYKFGGIPLFTPNLEVVRFQVRISGYIHMLSILSRIVVIIIGSYWIGKNEINFKNEKVLIFNFILAFTLLLFTGFRGEIIVPIAILVIQYFLTNKINYKIIFISSIVIVLVLGIWPIFRNISSYGETYIYNLKNISRNPNLFFLMPLFSTFAMNFEVLRKLTLTFPSLVNYGYGYYTFLQPFSVILPGVKLPSIYDVQNIVWDTGFYSGLTSTYLGTLYADGGVFFILIFNLLLGILITLLYNYMIKANKWSLIGVYSYIYYLILLGIYSYGFTIDNILYTIMIYFVYRICE